MTRILTFILLGLLASCGGSNDVEAPPAPAEPVNAAPNNPLADQQQLIRDAKAVQDLLDKDAEAKKKALSDLR